MKIVLDPGHGAQDSGAVDKVTKRRESHDTLNYAKMLKKELESRGHNVLMTRETDTYPTLTERAEFANRNNADVFLSLHRNASDGNGHGGEVLYAPGRTDIAKCKNLAECVNKHMNKATSFRDRGAKCQSATVLKKTKMPAVTVEAGFVDNASDNKKFDDNLPAMVKGIADGIEESFGIAKKPTQTTTPSVSKPTTTPTVNYSREIYNTRPTGKETVSYIKGNDVKALQKKLIDLGYNLGSSGADGTFGKLSEIAVKDWQSKHPSGIVDKDTWDGIMKS